MCFNESDCFAASEKTQKGQTLYESDTKTQRTRSVGKCYECEKNL